MNAFHIFLFILLGIGLLGCGNNKEKQTDQISVPVRLAKVERKAVQKTIIGSGTLASKTEVMLSFKTGGIVKKFAVDEGSQVHGEQVLASLDLSEIKARHQQAKSALDKAERDYQRMTILFEDSVITLEQWQNTETALEIARSNMNIADFNFRYSIIKAPSKGRILKRFVESGELIKPGTPILLFGSAEDNWILRIGVPDHTVLDLAIGDSAQVCFDAYPQQTFKALVSEIAAAADPRSGTFEVELVLLPTDVTLLSGFVGKVQIFPTKKEIMNIIPVHAISEGNRKKGNVFIISSDQMHALKLPVQIAGINNSGVLISSGLEGIDEIIGDGASYLSDSTRIRLVN